MTKKETTIIPLKYALFQDLIPGDLFCSSATDSLYIKVDKINSAVEWKTGQIISYGADSPVRKVKSAELIVRM